MTAGQGQTGRIGLPDTVRDHILSDPEAILDDAEVMRALVAANDRGMGANVVDLRGVAMRRLEGRLGRLEDTHRTVIAAAYENLAGSNLIQRAVLQLLEPVRFEEFLETLGGRVAQTLRVDALGLVLESQGGPGAVLPDRLAGLVRVGAPGLVEGLLGQGRAAVLRPVLLRQVTAGDALLHGLAAPDIRSEALLRLDLGPGRLPGLLVLGAEDPHQFRPAQGTDLLAFLAGVVERAMRRWLA
jgi:uncharacterized protein